MPSKYKFHNPEGLYFVTLTIIDWVDIFSREIYRKIMIDSLNYSIINKGLVLHAWVIMSNHLHLIISAKPNYKLSEILRDMKKFTSKQIITAIKDNKKESRKKWMLRIFIHRGLINPNNKKYQVWKQDNHPVDLDTNIKIDQRLDYLHNNPVKAGLVFDAEHYVYSSAIDYAGGSGILPLELID